MTTAEKVLRAQEMREIPVCECSNCGEGIYNEDPYWDIYGDIFCEECIREFKSYMYAGRGMIDDDMS